MKTIDRLIITSFIPPFVVTFFIALFVLMMQSLWVYIDEIIGKGASFFMILEYLFYLSISFIPLALPLGVLISSVMVMGNFAERYELASMKSAGMSLVRILMPLVFVNLGIALFSYVCSEYITPVANLKFRSRLNDIRTKPTLAIEAGIFNNSFENYTIRVGKKERDGRTISDIMVYSQPSGVISAELVAQNGEMYATEDQQFMVMHLRDGKRYEAPNSTAKNQKYPFVRMYFKEYTKVFDMTKFEGSRTNENRFKHVAAGKTIKELRHDIDSIGRMIVEREKRMSNVFGSIYHFYNLSDKPKKDSIQAKKDTLKTKIVTADSLKKLKNIVKKPKKAKKTTLADELKLNHLIKNKDGGFKPPPLELEIATKPILTTELLEKCENAETFWAYLYCLRPFAPYERSQYINASLANCQRVRTEAETAIADINSRMALLQAKYAHEIHTKFVTAAMCFIFLFIGAPMGAIVRKGGFGYPLLIAIAFFMLYMMLSIMFKRFTEQLVLSPIEGAWGPAAILSIIGAFLTYKAMRESRMIDIDRIVAWGRKMIGKIQRKKI